MGNFRGRKLARISRFCSNPRKFSPQKSYFCQIAKVLSLEVSHYMVCCLIILLGECGALWGECEWVLSCIHRQHGSYVHSAYVCNVYMHNAQWKIYVSAVWVERLALSLCIFPVFARLFLPHVKLSLLILRWSQRYSEYHYEQQNNSKNLSIIVFECVLGSHTWCPYVVHVRRTIHIQCILFEKAIWLDIAQVCGCILSVSLHLVALLHTCRCTLFLNLQFTFEPGNSAIQRLQT